MFRGEFRGEFRGLLRVRIVPPIAVVAEFHDYIFSGGISAPKANAPLFRNRFVLSAASKLLGARVPFGSLGVGMGWLPGSA